MLGIVEKGLRASEPYCTPRGSTGKFMPDVGVEARSFRPCHRCLCKELSPHSRSRQFTRISR